jgi:SAM-dependent methyltransferase
MMNGPVVFDRALLGRRRARAARMGPATFLIDRVADHLAERFAVVTRTFDIAVDLGTPTPALRQALAAFPNIGTLVALGSNREEGAALWPLRICADEEALPLGEQTVDLVVSALALQFVNDLPGTLVQIRRALAPDGLFLAALVGGNTLTELRQALAVAEVDIEGGISPRVAPFVDVREMGALLQRAGFALPVTDVDRLVVRYETAVALMQDLRRMGATNALVERRHTPLRRATLMRAAQVYRERFSDPGGRVRATFEIVFASGWAPHQSQQQPLRPGSARARLADALGTKELSAGDKAGT